MRRGISFIGVNFRRLEVCGFRMFRFDSALFFYFFVFRSRFFPFFFFVYFSFSSALCSSRISDGIREYFDLGKNRRVCWFLCIVFVVIERIAVCAVATLSTHTQYTTHSALTIQRAAAYRIIHKFKYFSESLRSFFASSLELRSPCLCLNTDSSLHL